MNKVIGPMIENVWTQDEIEMLRERTTVNTDHVADTIEEAQQEIMRLQAEVMQLRKRAENKPVALDSIAMDQIVQQDDTYMPLSDIMDEVTYWGIESIDGRDAATKSSCCYVELKHCVDHVGTLYVLEARDIKTKMIKFVFLTRDLDTAKSEYVELAK